MTPTDTKRIAEAIAATELRDIPGMTVIEHHCLCAGVLACCFEHVPPHLQAAIVEALDSAERMGMNINPVLVTQPGQQGVE